MARKKNRSHGNLQFSDETRKAFGSALLNSSTQARIIQLQIGQMKSVDRSVGHMVFTAKEQKVIDRALDDLDDVIRICTAVGRRAKTRARL